MNRVSKIIFLVFLLLIAQVKCQKRCYRNWYDLQIAAGSFAQSYCCAATVWLPIRGADGNYPASANFICANTANVGQIKQEPGNLIYSNTWTGYVFTESDMCDSRRNVTCYCCIYSTGGCSGTIYNGGCDWISNKVWDPTKTSSNNGGTYQEPKPADPGAIAGYVFLALFIVGLIALIRKCKQCCCPDRNRVEVFTIARVY